MELQRLMDAISPAQQDQFRKDVLALLGKCEAAAR